MLTASAPTGRSALETAALPSGTAPALTSSALTPTAGEPATPAPRRLALTLWLLATLGIAVALLVDVGSRVAVADLTRPTDVVLVLTGVVVIIEALQLALTRDDEVLPTTTISSTFILAVAMLGPAWILLAATGISAAMGAAQRGRHPWRLLLDAATLVVAAAGARAMFCLLTDRAYLADDRGFQLVDVAPGLVAGLVYFVLHTAIGVPALALAHGGKVLPQLRQELAFRLSTSGVLLGFAPVVVVASGFSPLLLPLMLLPVAAVHRSAGLAVERQRQSLTDALTGLPNRAMLSLRTTRALEQGQRSETATAVMLIDLDRFKEINDTLGHYVGDELLRHVGSRLQAAVRKEDLVARLGGDEFAVLAVGLRGRVDADDVASRLFDALRQPFSVEGVRLDVQASIGVALAPEHGSDLQGLLRRADVALYSAKENRGCTSFYTEESDPHSVERLALVGDLREGIPGGQLRVHFQPKCQAGSGALVGLEALVRWQHPTLGLLPPDDFIPMAENTGLIGPLTLEVLDQALGTARRLRDAGRPLGVAVNISVRVLTDLELPARVGELLARWGVPPTSLTLEVTESTIMVDPVRTTTVLGLLRDLGVSLSIDDFGTGYSSLSYLKRLEANELKIDKSFVMSMTTDSNDAVIVRSTIELGHSLGLRLVAEGVEDRQTWDMLGALGCDIIQGYHLSRPLPSADVGEWVRAYDEVRLPLPRR